MRDIIEEAPEIWGEDSSTDSATVEHAYAPAFPEQRSGFSYGIGRELTVRHLLEGGADLRLSDVSGTGSSARLGLGTAAQRRSPLSRCPVRSPLATSFARLRRSRRAYRSCWSATSTAPSGPNYRRLAFTYTRQPPTVNRPPVHTPGQSSWCRRLRFPTSCV